MKKLSKDFLTEYQDFRGKVGELEAELGDRIEYILQTIAGTEINCWYVDGAEEGSVGDLFLLIAKERLNLDRLIKLDNDGAYVRIMKTIILDDGEWDLGSSVPLRWLYEDFEDELAEGVEKYKEKNEAKKRTKEKATLTKKQNKNKLLESAKKKLTKEEQKALGLR